MRVCPAIPHLRQSRLTWWDGARATLQVARADEGLGSACYCHAQCQKGGVPVVYPATPHSGMATQHPTAGWHRTCDKDRLLAHQRWKCPVLTGWKQGRTGRGWTEGDNEARSRLVD
eukprot:365024-Chlamydomonas_euryale.AAC.2